MFSLSHICEDCARQLDVIQYAKKPDSKFNRLVISYYTQDKRFTYKRHFNKENYSGISPQLKNLSIKKMDMQNHCQIVMQNFEFLLKPLNNN